ncbi:MAG: hypothetical protein JWO77_1147, partial [Ilumatobacteraceae bacterium]|nr:hypothetical protein [Ilumatobacteraceae bacterium]
GRVGTDQARGHQDHEDRCGRERPPASPAAGATGDGHDHEMVTS